MLINMMGDNMHLALHWIFQACRSDISALMRTVEASAFGPMHLSFSHVGYDKGEFSWDYKASLRLAHNTDG